MPVFFVDTLYAFFLVMQIIIVWKNEFCLKHILVFYVLWEHTWQFAWFLILSLLFCLFIFDIWTFFLVLFRLISTDATARGIDIKGVKCVINYDAPQFIRTYIHRCVCFLAHIASDMAYYISPLSIHHFMIVICIGPCHIECVKKKRKNVKSLVIGVHEFITLSMYQVRSAAMAILHWFTVWWCLCTYLQRVLAFP